MGFPSLVRWQLCIDPYVWWHAVRPIDPAWKRISLKETINLVIRERYTICHGEIVRCYSYRFNRFKCQPRTYEELKRRHLMARERPEPIIALA